MVLLQMAVRLTYNNSKFQMKKSLLKTNLKFVISNITIGLIRFASKYNDLYCFNSLGVLHSKSP